MGEESAGDPLLHQGKQHYLSANTCSVEKRPHYPSAQVELQGGLERAQEAEV